MIAVTLLAVATACGLWWTYFFRSHPALEHAMAARSGAEQSAMARDAFTIAHYPMVCGVIAFAVAAEEAVAHPAEPLALAARGTLALGLFLFVGGMAAAVWHATSRLLWPRIGLTALTGGAVVVAAVWSPLLSLAIAFVGVVSVAAVERRAGRSVTDPLA